MMKKLIVVGSVIGAAAVSTAFAARSDMDVAAAGNTTFDGALSRPPLAVAPGFSQRGRATHAAAPNLHRKAPRYRGTVRRFEVPLPPSEKRSHRGLVAGLVACVFGGAAFVLRGVAGGVSWRPGFMGGKKTQASVATIGIRG